MRKQGLSFNKKVRAFNISLWFCTKKNQQKTLSGPSGLQTNKHIRKQDLLFLKEKDKSLIKMISNYPINSFHVRIIVDSDKKVTSRVITQRVSERRMIPFCLRNRATTTTTTTTSLDEKIKKNSRKIKITVNIQNNKTTSPINFNRLVDSIRFRTSPTFSMNC